MPSSATARSSFPQALSADEVGILDEAFNLRRHAGNDCFNVYDGEFTQAIGGLAGGAPFTRALAKTHVADIASALFGGGPVWFFEEQVFDKQAPLDKSARRTAWHQDASYQPFVDQKNVVLWMSFDPVTREEALEVVLGSHKGPLYNGITLDRDDDTKPAFPNWDVPRMLNIEAERDKSNIREKHRPFARKARIASERLVGS